MQFYNTMSRKKEMFTPVRKGLVGVYACGITAYALSHIGHARSAVAFDILVRLLRYKGYEVTFVRNFTDVDDKIIKRANDEGVSSTEIAETYIKAYHEDMDRLNVIRADIEPKATEHIQEMLNLTERLIADGKAVAHFGDLLLLLLLRSDHCEIENHDHYNEKHRHKPGVGRICGSVARRRRVEVCHYCVQHFILSSGILITK